MHVHCELSPINSFITAVQSIIEATKGGEFLRNPPQQLYTFPKFHVYFVNGIDEKMTVRGMKNERTTGKRVKTVKLESTLLTIHYGVCQILRRTWSRLGFQKHRCFETRWLLNTNFSFLSICSVPFTVHRIPCGECVIRIIVAPANPAYFTLIIDFWIPFPVYAQYG
jgi:hypothetical protein